jgi:phospholipase/carboxylesterase
VSFMGPTDSKSHRDQPVLTLGASLEEAKAAMIMVHGRGASAENILALTTEFEGDGWAFLGPQAANHTWYPYSFLEPMEKNEPHLSEALQHLGELAESVIEAGIPRERIVLLGFSQGACLSTEFSVRNPGRYAGVVALSGGLIGPPGTPRDYQGSMDGTPAFLGCSDVDFHIPVERVHETDEVMSRMGADVTCKIYPGMGHTINHDEVKHIRALMASIEV